MAVASSSQSVEYATMVECFDALVLGISPDPQTMANKLFSVGLVPANLVDRILLQPRENYDKATEIVSLVMKKVEGSPETLEVFMSILADLPSLHDLVGSLHEKYERNKNVHPEEVVEVLPTGNEQVTSFSVDSEEHVRLQREKEELEKERSQLIQEIQSQNDQLSKSKELLLSAQKKKEEFFNKNVELEAEKKNIRQTVVATKEKLSTEIKMKEEDIKLKEEYIKLKKKEIESFKKSLQEREELSLIEDHLQQVHMIDTASCLQSSTSNLKSHSAGEDKYKQQFITAIEDAIASGKINRRLAHSIVIGPPGSGKSSMIDRLLKRLRRRIAKSTGVCNSVIIVDIEEINPSRFHVATGIDTETWKEVDYEVSIVNQLGEKSGEKPTSTEHAERVQLTHVKKTIKQVMSKVLQLVSIWHKKNVVIPMSAEKVISIIEKYGFEAFRNYLQKTFSLYLRDTGGQVEFQEMLPLLISGPSIFFFVFRVDLDFQSKFTVEYRTGESKSLNSYTSSITTEEALLQCLASVYAMDTYDELRVKTHKPLVFIVGTHIDQLGPSADAKVFELDQQIDTLIKKNGFQDIVQYADKNENRVFFPVDNTSENDDAFIKIRSNVNSLIYGRDEFAIEYPVSYLLLCLDLQNEERNILTMGNFRALASRHGIEGDDVFDLLQFLHLRIGIVRYYDAEGLRDIIVIEPQVLFNTITDLVVKTFSCKALTSSEVSDFEKKGLFTASVLKSVISSSALSREITSGESISVDKFVQLLVHLRIIAPFIASKDQEEKYFIPCVLNHVPESTEEALKTDILPLAVKFQCNHSPKGVFGVLVSHLLTRSAADSASSITFSLMEEKIFKDQVSFEVGFSGEVSLTIFSSHLAIKFFPYPSEDSELPIEEVCCGIREILEELIHSSLRDLHYSEDRVQPKMCFECQEIDCPELHPVTRGNQFHKMLCTTAHKIIRLPPQARCWYGEKVTSEDTRNLVIPEHSERINARRSGTSNKSTHVIGSTDIDRITEEEFARASEILKPYSHKWRMIGEGLGFKASELDNIMSRPLLLLDAPNSYLSAVLSEWKLWAPGDHRGSSAYATLHSLRMAVDKAGLGLTAQELA